MDIDAYLKSLEEINSGSEKEKDEYDLEEMQPISKWLQTIVEFEEETLWVNKLSTNVRKSNEKRQINITTKEYNIGPLRI